MQTMHLIACGFWIACLGLIALGVTRFDPESPTAPQATRTKFLERCAGCHTDVLERYLDTAHARTSAAGDSDLLVPRPAEVTTSVPTTRFRVERRADGMHQIARWLAAGREAIRSERIDLIVGSGRRGQSYLYWKDGLLFQLPLSYLVTAGRWVNSPGYVDGEVNFDRVIPPRCLECHTTSFRVEGISPRLKYAADYELGLACQVCHGRASEHSRAPGPSTLQGRPEPGRGTTSSEPSRDSANAHAAGGIVNPAKLTRQQQIDLCGLCHAGADPELRRPPFTFTPGDRLTDHLRPLKEPDVREPDVHGSQVALLAASRCFQKSPAMTCSTCHDVHRTERNLAQLSKACVQCHSAEPPAARQAGLPGPLPKSHAAPATWKMTCVDCHMPLRPSRLIRIAVGDTTVAPSYRTHRIAIYPHTGSPAGPGGRGDRR
jgi:hypothetical protein